MRKAIVIAALAAGVLIPAAGASACQCVIAPEDETSRKNIDRADFIFEGSVLEISEPEGTAKYDGTPLPPHENKIFSRTELTITKRLKGPADVSSITVYADTGTSCGTTAESLEKQEFFVVYEHLGDYVLAGRCGDFITKADREALENGSYEQVE